MSSFASTVGFKYIFQNERISFMLGLVLFCLAIYFILSFVSFFSTGAADQTLIESPRDGEIANVNGEFANSCGSLGAYTAYFFIKQCFGLSAFLIPIFLFLVSLRLMKAYTRVSLLKWFFALAILMIWTSVCFAKLLSPFFSNSFFNP